MTTRPHSRARQSAPTITDDQARTLHDYLTLHASGHKQALPARQLISALGLGRNGDRELRALAHRAADLGLLICADNAGYFIPADPDEVKSMVARLRSQAAEMNERARRIETLAGAHFFSRQMALL